MAKLRKSDAALLRKWAKHYGGNLGADLLRISIAIESTLDAEPVGEIKAPMNCMNCGLVFDSEDDPSSIFHEQSCRNIKEDYDVETAHRIGRRLNRPLHPPEDQETCCSRCGEAVTKTRYPLCRPCAEAISHPPQDREAMERLRSLAKPETYIALEWDCCVWSLKVSLPETADRLVDMDNHADPADAILGKGE